MTVEWIVEFTHFLICFQDAADVGETPESEDEIVLVNEDLTGICISSPRYGRFAYLRVDLLETRPQWDSGEWDYIGEFAICTLSGAMEVSTTCGSLVYQWNDREQVPGEFSVDPGIYRVCVFVANLSSTRNRLAEAEDDDYANVFYGSEVDGDAAMPDNESLMGLDRYRIAIWPLRDTIHKAP